MIEFDSRQSKVSKSQLISSNEMVIYSDKEMLLIEANYQLYKLSNGRYGQFVQIQEDTIDVKNKMVYPTNSQNRYRDSIEVRRGRIASSFDPTSLNFSDYLHKYDSAELRKLGEYGPTNLIGYQWSEQNQSTCPTYLEIVLGILIESIEQLRIATDPKLIKRIEADKLFVF